VWSTGYKIPPDFEGDRVPIGRSIPDVQNYILDHLGHLAPIGVPGELCIGGAGVTAGYLDRPELTAERFVEHSIAGMPPIRLYHTGDLARYLPDGNIEFLGRIDHQVKIRGFRVELAEIETVLNQHVEVREAVVVAREDVPGDKRLAAYVVPVQGQSPAPGELRSYLQAKLPDYMVPFAYVSMEALPLTPNGKVDRQRLPAPGAIGLDADETPFLAPRTRTEETVAGIWAQVLGQERVGIHDNFFDLGGHSLSVTRVVSRLRDAFQIDLPLSKLFELPTLSELSKHIDMVCQTMRPPQSASGETDEREVIVL
jgi:non-ribosomal peptide synthetase component F